MKRILCLILLSALFLSLRSENIDSLFTQYQKESGRHKSEIAWRIIRAFEADEYYDNPIQASSRDKRYSKMLVYIGMAIQQFEQNNFPKAIEYAKTAEASADKDSLQWLCTCYEILNVSYQRQGDYAKALKYAQKALEVGEVLHDDQICSNALNSLAAIHCSTHHLDDALRYIDKAIDLERKTKSGAGKSLAVRLGSKCEILALMNRPDEALQCINEALLLDSAANRTEKVGIRLSQKAEILMKEQRWDECRQICLQALGIFEETGRAVDKAITLKQLGQCELALHNLDAAEGYLYSAEKLCKDLGLKPLLWKTQFLQHQVYSEKKDYQKALHYLTLSSTNKDSLNQEEFDKIIGEYKVKYETAEKEQQLKLQAIKIHNRNLLAIVLACLFVLGCITTVIAYRLASVRKKRNRALADLNAMKDQLFSIISHDLKNPVAAQKQVIDALNSHFDEIGDAEKKEQLQALKQSHDNLNSLLLNLLEWASLESGRLTYKPIRADLSSIVRRSIQFASSSAKNKNITLSQQVSDECIVCTDVNFMQTILRNLLSNAIKFSHEGGTVEIVSEQTIPGKVTLAVTDHGIGMTEEQIAGLFVRDISTPGTHGEKGTGLGLLVCQRLIEKGAEEIRVTSEKGVGSTFYLDIPIAE
ncbi:MAG: tetratricopeptide repeat-containing sensor histidine kinase [Bacteroidales bacterium]|nr:tetratricopeptide repeat-containing sensor histidine kinase [Bacteroidales bacterium]